MRWVVSAWIPFVGLFVIYRLKHFRRGEPGARAPWGRWGMVLQGLAILSLFAFRVPPREQMLPWAMGLAAAAILLAWWSILALGRHLRFAAVVTEEHELVTHGPYAFRRHPIFLALFGMLAATAMVLTSWWAALPAAAVYAAGTEIRVRAEDGLLRQRFPEDFPGYRARVRGWLL